jgi:hypothetical protein
MSARDKIAKLMWPAMLYASKVDGAGPAWVDGGNSLAQVEARQAADAILAALPDMIAPLVWVSQQYNIAAKGSGYCYSLINTHGHYSVAVLSPGSAKVISRATSEDKAQAAANAHHRASIMAAFNGGAQT